MDRKAVAPLVGCQITLNMRRRWVTWPVPWGASASLEASCSRPGKTVAACPSSRRSRPRPDLTHGRAAQRWAMRLRKRAAPAAGSTRRPVRPDHRRPPDTQFTNAMSSASVEPAVMLIEIVPPRHPSSPLRIVASVLERKGGRARPTSVVRHARGFESAPCLLVGNSKTVCVAALMHCFRTSCSTRRRRHPGGQEPLVAQQQPAADSRVEHTECCGARVSPTAWHGRVRR